MRYETLPGSSLRISAVGMGCYAAAGVYGDFDEEAFVSLLRLGHEMGVTFYDTAPTYGDGERILADAVKPFRNEVVIATKVGLTQEGGRDCSPDQILRSCEESLVQLGTDYIDLYQVHYDDPQTPVAETIGALNSLKEQGKIRQYGVGHLPIDRVRAYLELGTPVTVLAELNCVTRGQYQQIWPMVRKVSGIIGFSPSARGLFAGRVSGVMSSDDHRSVDPLYRGGKFRSALRVLEVLQGLAEETGSTPVQVAMRWALELPGVAAVLTGTASRQHLLENLDAVSIPWDEDRQCRLNGALEREDARFRAELPDEIRAILLDAKPLSEDVLWDLVYVMEQVISSGWVEEGEILPLFTRLWEMRTSGIDEKRVRSIRAALLELLF